jgi:5-methylcytosine-specific restriction endonuclease McrA
METTTAHDIDRRLAEMVRRERHLVVQFVLELADFARRELHRELGYPSLFYYCLRQLGLSRSSAFRRSEAAALVNRFPAVAEAFRDGRLSLRSLVELREVFTEENHAQVLARAAGMTQEEAQLLAVEYKPRPTPRDVVRALPLKESSHMLSATLVSAGTSTAMSGGAPAVSAETGHHPAIVSVTPLTTQLRRLNVTVSADFIAELEQARAALSHAIPDGDFEQVVREGLKLILERHRKRKGLTERPRKQPAKVAAASGRHIPAAVRRTVWERDQGRCTWLMGDGKVCGSTRQVEFDHNLELVLGGESTPGNLRLLCRSHNLMKAEDHLGRGFMAKFRRASRPVGQSP